MRPGRPSLAVPARRTERRRGVRCATPHHINQLTSSITGHWRYRFYFAARGTGEGSRAGRAAGGGRPRHEGMRRGRPPRLADRPGVAVEDLTHLEAYLAAMLRPPAAWNSTVPEDGAQM